MKILAFTDPHGDLRHARTIRDKISSGHPDLIVCSGDFSEFGNNAIAFFQALSDIEQPIYLVGGNHESFELVKHLTERFKFLVDVAFTTVVVKGVTIAGLPGYDADFWPSFDVKKGTVNLVQEIFRDRSDGPFILLTHFPPEGAVDGLAHSTPDSGGSATVRAIVRATQPDLVVTGHYHQEFRKSGQVAGSLVMNPGPDGKSIPMIVVEDRANMY